MNLEDAREVLICAATVIALCATHPRTTRGCVTAGRHGFGSYAH